MRAMLRVSRSWEGLKASRLKSRAIETSRMTPQEAEQQDSGFSESVEWSQGEGDDIGRLKLQREDGRGTSQSPFPTGLTIRVGRASVAATRIRPCPA